MVLVSPNLPDPRKRDPLHAFLREFDGAGEDILVRQGVIVSHLNYSNELRRNNSFNDDPLFARDWFYDRHFQEMVDKNPGNPYYVAELEAYNRIPNDPTLFNKEAFRDFWRREVTSIYDTDEQYAKNLAERPFVDFEPHLSSYGVVDSPEQLLNLYDFERDPRYLFIILTPLIREKQYPEGGWRWHKWGPYYGTHTPKCEYLYDEVGIDRVYVYHIYELLNFS